MATCFSEEKRFCITTQDSLGLLAICAEPEVRTVVIPDFTHADLLRLLLGEQGSESPGGWLSAYTRYLTDPTPHAREQVLADPGRLLDPVLSAVPGDIEHLVFLSSTQLFLFSLHAVPLAGERGERVCNRYRVRYTPSLEVLADTQVKAAQEVPPTLYALLNPQADPRLAFASREGTTLTALFPHSTCDEGRTGTRQQVISGVRGRTYLHSACRPVRPVSPTVAGGSAEEYVGVPAGLLLAGVPSVVGSLWRAPDLATLLLMEHLYQSHLHGRMALPAALHEGGAVAWGSMR